MRVSPTTRKIVDDVKRNVHQLRTQAEKEISRLDELNGGGQWAKKARSALRPIDRVIRG